MSTAHFVRMQSSICPICKHPARGGRHRNGTCPPKMGASGIRKEHLRKGFLAGTNFTAKDNLPKRGVVMSVGSKGALQRKKRKT